MDLGREWDDLGRTARYRAAIDIEYRLAMIDRRTDMRPPVGDQSLRRCHHGASHLHRRSAIAEQQLRPWSGQRAELEQGNVALRDAIRPDPGGQAEWRSRRRQDRSRRDRAVDADAAFHKDRIEGCARSIGRRGAIPLLSDRHAAQRNQGRSQQSLNDCAHEILSLFFVKFRSGLGQLPFAFCNELI
jgi:hypothetical protein